MNYLDNNATTCIAPEVLEAMLPWLREFYGNASAGYRFGKKARKAIDEAREKVAALLGALPEEIVFTSGGTESNNTAIHSALELRPERRGLLCSEVEHSAIVDVLKHCESRGYQLIRNPVDSQGWLDLEAWKEAVATGDLAIACLIWANNETGVMSPLAEAAEIAAQHDVFFHADAVQAVGKIPVRVADLPLHTLSMSAHKIHGPKGIGALWINRRARFAPQSIGGGQESGRRSGTENVPGIVGLGVAAELAITAVENREKIARLRDRFEHGVLEAVEGCQVNGDPLNRLPNTSNLYFPGIDAEGLLILLDNAGVCCSPGSACSTGQMKPSRILLAMGLPSARARSSVRFSISRYTTEEEIDQGIHAVAQAAQKLRVVMGNR